MWHTISAILSYYYLSTHFFFFLFLHAPNRTSGWYLGLTFFINCPSSLLHCPPLPGFKGLLLSLPQGRSFTFFTNQKECTLSSVCALCVLMANIHEHAHSLLQNRYLSWTWRSAGRRGLERLPRWGAWSQHISVRARGHGMECRSITQSFSTPQKWSEKALLSFGMHAHCRSTKEASKTLI